MKDLSLLAAKRFSYKDVMEPDEDYASLGVILNECVEKGWIRPVKASGRVSFAPYFYREYFVIPKRKTAHADPEEILRLAPALLEYYSDHPDHYVQDAEVLIPLSTWMKQEELHFECSLKERSYQIFHNEKLLESESACRILNRCGLCYEDLGCYRTYEPFFCERISEEGYALVLENKDPWVSIVKAMRRKNTSLFLGRKIMCVIYGEGRKVDSCAEASRLQDFFKGLNPAPSAVLYCGDIDRAGIAIYEKCREVNPDAAIEPFPELYRAMAAKAPADPMANEPAEDHKTRTPDLSFAEIFEDPSYVRTVLTHNLRIPQEILTLRDYLELCGGENGIIS